MRSTDLSFGLPKLPQQKYFIEQMKSKNLQIARVSRIQREERDGEVTPGMSSLIVCLSYCKQYI